MADSTKTFISFERLSEYDKMLKTKLGSTYNKIITCQLLAEDPDPTTACEKYSNILFLVQRKDTTEELYNEWICMNVIGRGWRFIKIGYADLGQYIKDIKIENNVLIITKSDGTVVRYSGGGKDYYAGDGLKLTETTFSLGGVSADELDDMAKI